MKSTIKNMITWENIDTHQLINHLHTKGYVVIQVPNEFAQSFKQLNDDARNFFSNPQPYKDTYRTPSLTGYMTPYPGLHEVFEMKDNSSEEKYQIPPQISESGWTAYHNLREITVKVLEIVSMELTQTKKYLDILDDSTLRFLHYDNIYQSPADTAEQFIPLHTDSSIFTVSPKALQSGLEVKQFDTNQWVNMDDILKDDEVIVFGGEVISRLTYNYIPSLLHRPKISTMQQSQTTRISTPFFLRGRPDALIKSSSTNPLEPVSVEDISNNINNCRDTPPWKQLAYYT